MVDPEDWKPYALTIICQLILDFCLLIFEMWEVTCAVTIPQSYYEHQMNNGCEDTLTILK